MQIKKTQEISGFILTSLIGILPVFMLSLGHTSAIFYLTITISLIVCLARVGNFSATKNDWFRYRWLAICLFWMMFVILLTMAVEQHVLGAALERSIRIAGGVFLTLGACLSLKPDLLRQAAWGLGFAALISGIICWWLALPSFSRPDVPEYNAVSYGNLALMVTTITAFSLGWRLTACPGIEKCLKLIMATIGLSGFLLTQTRSGWLATPFFLLFALLLFKDKYSTKKLLIISIVSLMVLFAIFSSNRVLVSRAQLAVSELNNCFKDPLAYNSTCIRIQLWRSSWELFKDNPVLGIRGGQHFNERLQPLIERKIINKKIVEDGFGEPHNDMMFMMASHGSLGLLSLLLIYFSPAFIFAGRLIRNHSQEIRVAAAMGLCICFGFFISGLTETMFRGMRTMGFYAVTIAWLLALSDPIYIQRQSRLNKSAW